MGAIPAAALLGAAIASVGVYVVVDTVIINGDNDNGDNVDDVDDGVYTYPTMHVTIDDQVETLYLAHYPDVYSGEHNYAQITMQKPGHNKRYLAHFRNDDEFDVEGYFHP